MSASISEPRRVAPPGVQPGRLFGSMFLGGFECSTHRTPEGRQMDLIAATQHDRFAAEDYERCRSVGIRAVREAARWPIADTPGGRDLAEVRRLARLGREHGLIQIWDLFHYGYPIDLDPGADDFADRVVDRLQWFAAGVAAEVKRETDGPTWWTPVNEISYTAWAGGEVGILSPFWHGRGWEYKVLLVRAAIAAFDAIRSVDPEASVLTAEPLVRLHVHPGVADDDERRRLQGEADDFNTRVVSEAYDMLAGRVAPELGGSPEHLGVVGVNYYEGNQWTIPTAALPQHFLGREDPSWVPLSHLLRDLGERYGSPIVVSETGSTGPARTGWLEHLVAEVEDAIALGVDVQGICLYPIVTSPDWNDPAAFFDGGLWDVEPSADGTLARVLEPDVARALRTAQLRLDPDNVTGALDGQEATAAPERPVAFAKLRKIARFSPDGFVCVPVFAGAAIVADLYCFEPGKSVAGHRHPENEHVLTTVQGRADVRVGERWFILEEGESVLIPRGVRHGIHNPTSDRLLVQQITTPKPWDARFGGARRSDVGPEPESAGRAGDRA